MTDHTFDCCDNIDAAIFTGDEFFTSRESREELLKFIKRWESEIRSIEDHLLKSTEEAIHELLKGK